MEIPQKRKGIAIALNNRIIPQSFWAETLLNDKDSILIITATQGG
jgi:sulfur carrier protein